MISFFTISFVQHTTKASKHAGIAGSKPYPWISYEENRAVITGRAVHSSTSHTSREKASIEELISTQEPKTDWDSSSIILQ